MDSCSICNQMMRSDVLQNHLRIHSSAGRPFKCSDGCFEHYFETDVELQQHCARLHEEPAKRPAGETPSMTPSVKRMNTIADLMPVTLPKVEPIDDVNQVSDINSDKAAPPETMAATRRSTMRSGNMSNTDRPTSSMTVESLSDAPKAPRLTMTCKECSKEISVSYMVRHLRYFHHIGVEKVERTEPRPERKSTVTTETKTTPNRTTPCQVCAKEVTNTNMARHLRTHGVSSNAKKSMCTVCNRMYNDLSRHMKAHNPTDRPFQCMKGCTLMFYVDQHVLNRHYGKYHNKLTSNRTTFSVTETPSSSSTSSPSHKQRHKICKICGRADSDYHRQSHNSTGRPFTCEKGCPRTYYKTLVALHLHYGKVHSKRRAISSGRLNGTAVGGVFRCKFGCSQTFMTTVALWQHVKLHHRKNGNMPSIKTEAIEASRVKHSTLPPCEICGKPCSANHMKMHDSSRPFKCTNGCIQRFFKTLSARDSHKSTHHRFTEPDFGESAYADMPASFPVMTPMGVVMAVRKSDAEIDRIAAADGERASNIWPDTVNHMKTHDSSSKKKFKCMYGCVERYFSSMVSLRVHKCYYHQGEATIRQPFAVASPPKVERSKCKICGRPSSGSHMKTHDPTGKSFSCKNGCAQAYFVTRMALKQHVTKAHPGEEAIYDDNLDDVHVLVEEAQSLPASPMVVAQVVESASSPSSSTATENEKKSLIMPETPEPSSEVNDVSMDGVTDVPDTTASLPEAERPTSSDQAFSTPAPSPAPTPLVPLASPGPSAPKESGVNVTQQRQESVMQMLLAMPNTPETAEARMKLLDLYALCNNA